MTNESFKCSYSAELVSLHSVLFPSLKSALVNQLWEILLHQLLDFLDGFLKALLCLACNMQIERRILILS